MWSNFGKIGYDNYVDQFVPPPSSNPPPQKKKKILSAFVPPPHSHHKNIMLVIRALARFLKLLIIFERILIKKSLQWSKMD